MAAIDFARGVGQLIHVSAPTPPPTNFPLPENRPPLPEWDADSTDPETGAHLPVVKDLNAIIEMRANLWSVTVPNCPAIPGGASGPAQERVLSYLFDRYPRNTQDQYLDIYCKRGYDDLWRSIPDSIVGSGQSEDAYVDDTKRILDKGRNACHFIRSKYYDDPNDLGRWYPLIDKLRKINGIKWAASAWEASLWMSPAQYRSMLDSDARQFPEIKWCVHLQQAYADFGPDGENHSNKFWNANFAVGVRHLLYQYVTTPTPWSAGMMQARGNDVLVRCGPGGPWNLSDEFYCHSFELLGVCQFHNSPDGDGRAPNEDNGDLKGLECLCTYGPKPMRGFGNGARNKDGSVL